MPATWVVLVLPGFPVSTAEAYRSWTPGDRVSGPALEQAVAALRENASVRLRNDLEPVAFRLRPELATLLECLSLTGPLASRMTGSGSALFGLYRDERAARRALAAIPAPAVLTRFLGRTEYGARLVPA